MVMARMRMSRGLVPKLPRVVWTVLAGDALSSIGTGLTLPFLVVYLHRVRGIALEPAALALAVLALAGFVGNPIGGLFSDRFGARNALIGGLVVSALGAGALALVRVAWEGFAAAAVVGLGAAVVWPAQDALLASVVGAAQRAGAFSVTRDTLRLEAAMPLYGHELNEEITPLEAGLGFAVDLEGRAFPGSSILAAIKRDGPKRIRVGLELAGKRVPREHYAIFSTGQPIGEITSGTFSPTLQKPIAMGYVSPQFVQPSTELSIDIRGAREPACVVKLPFYKRLKPART